MSGLNDAESKFHCGECGSDSHDTIVHDDRPVPAACIHMKGCTCGAAAEPHRILYMAGNELVCGCGAHLSNYGLTRTLPSVFAEHLRSALARPDDGGVA